MKDLLNKVASTAGHTASIIRIPSTTEIVGKAGYAYGYAQGVWEGMKEEYTKAKQKGDN